MAKIYIVKPEFLDREGNEELYELESKATDAIEAVAKHRGEKFDEKHYEQAVPQALLTLLQSFDARSALVASKCFVSGEIEEIGEDE